MTWLMDILKIYQEEQLLITYYVIKHLPLLKIYDGYQRGLVSKVYKFFDKKSSGDSVTCTNKSAIKSKIMLKQQLAEELHKPIIRKFEKRRISYFFTSNIWGADFVDMQLIRKYNNRFQFLLCVIDIFSKYA